jgi:tetratricopeptide (TPR) repeat protein
MRCARALAFVLSAAVFASPAFAQIPTKFTNLRVLPKDISRAELVLTMRGFAGALGVRCTHCHVGPDDLQGMDFATDEKQMKQIARTMLRMMRSINADYLDALPAREGTRQQVTCLTCHRREQRPPQPLPDLLLATIDAGGVSAAVEQYKKLRAEMLEAGLYDFRERSLNILATSLRDRKRLAEAIEILRFNTTMFPASADAQVNLADTAVQMGDLDLAEASYKRALELAPGHPAATKALDAVRAKRK